MRWLVLVCALGACDQVFGLGQTQPTRGIDARYFDAPADAPYACPPIGTTPQFAGALTEVLRQPCRAYTLGTVGGAAHAMAQCGGVGSNTIYDGPAEGPLTATNIVLDSATQSVGYMRLAPEDGRAIASLYDTSTTLFYVELFQLMGDGAWHDVHLITTLSTPGFAFYAQISTPTPEPGAHLLVLQFEYDPTPFYLYEFVDDANPDPMQPWHQLSMLSFDQNTYNVTDGFTMTPDGLRVVFLSEANPTGVYYADRAAITDAFSQPVLMPSVPETDGSDPFMTAGCARMYVSGLGAVFYATQ